MIPEDLSDLCTYTSFDTVDTPSTSINYTALMGQRSDILQCDGVDTISDISYNDTSCNSEEEADSYPIRVALVPSLWQGPPGAPLQLEVDLGGQVHTPSYVPLCAIINPRSGWNKIHDICTFLRQVGPYVMILSEHWGRKKPFQGALKSQHYKVV